MAPQKEKGATMPLQKATEPSAPYIQGPMMDWSMNDDLYSCFQTWQIACNLIFDSELCDLPEPRKVNTLLHWSGDFGIQQLKSWQKDASELTLEFLWKEFEAYCKPQSNELCAHYDVLKKLKQARLPCDDWYTKLQTQLHLCNYSAETEKVLLCHLFLFGLEDESFMSKIINEENPEITTAQLRQKLKCMEAGHATAKYIKGAEGPEQQAIHQVHGKKDRIQSWQKRQWPHTEPKQGQQQGKWFYGKKTALSQRPYTSSQEASKSTIKLEAN